MKWFYTILLLLSSQVQAAAPDSVQLDYIVSMSGMQAGKIDETFRKIGDHYTISSVTTPTGLLAMIKPGRIFFNSSGLISKAGLNPLHFEDKREDNPEKNASAEFNRATGQLLLLHQAARTVLALPEDTQDRLSAMYQFMYLDLKDTLSFFMTNGNKLDNYHYAIGKTEKLDTPAGQFDTIYLDSQAKAGESRTEIWLSTEYKLPCKMVITESNGNQYMQILSALKIVP